MKVTRIYYEKCFPLGGYSNEKVGMEVTLADGETPVEGFALAKKEVEKAHKFFAFNSLIISLASRNNFT